MLNAKLFLRFFVIAIFWTVLAGCGVQQQQDTSVTPPVGKQLLVGGALTLREMTTDGWIVYSDNATLTLHAAPIAGGAPEDIVKLGDDFAVSNWGKVVFAWSSKNKAAVAPLTVWTSTSGPHAVSSSSLAPWVAANVDGTAILYLDNVDPSGQTGDLVVAAGDGSSPKVLLTGLTGLQNGGCQALMGFAGTSALAAHCDGGAARATISAFAMPSWTRTDLAVAAADDWSTDPAGKLLLTATSAGTIVVPVQGGAPTTIDPAGSTGVLVANGTSTIYGAGSALRRSPVSAPLPVTLVDRGVGGLYSVSPDDNYVLYWSKMDPVHLVSDMCVASATTPGTPITLSSTETAGIFGDPFTADSSHALFSTDVDTTTQTSTLNSLALGTGAPQVVSTDVWVVRAATGAKIVFSDHYAWAGSRGHADVRTLDTSKSVEPTLIVNQADAELFLAPAHDAVVYTWSLDDGPRAGIYVAGIP